MTTKRKPLDYVTREAERFRNAPPGNRRRSDDVKALIRRVLRRAARECDGVAIDHHACANVIAAFKKPGAREVAEFRHEMARVAGTCRDAIRALAKGGR